MAQPPFKTDAIQIEPGSGDTLLVDRNTDGSLQFQDPNVSNPLRLSDLAGIRNVSGIFTVGTGDGAQYPTIQSAIDAAPVTATATNPALILISPGSYIETLLVEKDGIFIIGLGAVLIQPASIANAITIQEGASTTPERTHIEGIRVFNPHHGKACIYAKGGAGSCVAKQELSIINSDLVAFGVGSFQLRADTVNRVRVQGGTWADSSSTSLVRANEVTTLVIRDVDVINMLQLDYNTADPLPCLPGPSIYRVQNIGVIGDVQTELVGDGHLVLHGAPQVGNVTALGDQGVEITGSRIQDLLANGTSVVTLLGSSFDSYSGTGTVLEWDGLTYSTPSSGGGGGGSTTLSLVAGATLDAGDVVAINSQGEAVPATATAVANAWRIVGVTTGASTAGNPVLVFIGRSNTPTKFSIAPPAISNGQDVFLDAALGEVTLTPPTSSGNVIVRTGVLQGANGVSLTPNVLFIPEIIALIP